tara:strand:+ start:19158 stop:19511 length:354 start_codon:yes stop_codon:yes gene_type:complete
MKTNENPARAKKGGEIGANGEFYKGGAFIATTDHAKGAPRKARKARKQEVAPYVWEVAPEDGLKSLFGALGGVEEFNEGKFTFNERLSASYYGSPEQVAQRKDRIAAFNNGERWFQC